VRRQRSANADQGTPDQPPNSDPCIGDLVAAYLNRPDVQRALHANTTGQCLGPWVSCTPNTCYSWCARLSECQRVRRRWQIFLSYQPRHPPIFQIAAGPWEGSLGCHHHPACRCLNHSHHYPTPLHPPTCSDDVITSMLPVYQRLLGTGLKILVYSGDLDAIIPGAPASPAALAYSRTHAHTAPGRHSGGLRCDVTPLGPPPPTRPQSWARGAGCTA
jgi:hypothetical protein